MRGVLDPAGAWSSRLRGSENFPSPFLDMASLAMPDSNRNALEWCQHIFMANETLRMAIDRIISYFLTDLDFGAVNHRKLLGEDEKEKWKEFMHNQLHVLRFIKELDTDKACYGNAFASVIVPFKRLLLCPKCRSVVFTLKELASNPVFKFKFANWGFHAQCPQCRYQGEWTLMDEPITDPGQITLRRWDPKQIVINHSFYSEAAQYYWNIPETDKQLIKEAAATKNLFQLEQVPAKVLEAIKKNELYKFNKHEIYHMKEPVLAGIQSRGWGISRLITCFRQVWYVQVLRRYNEAIALDYVIPFRLITPDSKGSSGTVRTDPLLTANMGNFSGQVRQMIRRRRRNPAEWYTLPFPVNYQILGGEATQLAPRDLLDQGLETLLNGAGVPVELYKGSLQVQTAPVAMRLFEATHYALVYDNNDFLRWLSSRISKVLSWEDVKITHKRVSHADDMQRHMALLQLMMGGAISQTTGLEALGINYRDQLRLLAEEARAQQEQQTEMQDEMAASDMGRQMAQGQMQPGMPPGQGGAPAGGAPVPGQAVDPNTGQPVPGPVTSMIQNNYMPQTPDEMMGQAQSLAQQLMGMPESQKDSELRMLKQKNEVLHSLVRAEMDKMRSKARSQGGAQVLAQQFGGGGAMPPM